MGDGSHAEEGEAESLRVFKSRGETPPLLWTAQMWKGCQVPPAQEQVSGAPSQPGPGDPRAAEGSEAPPSDVCLRCSMLEAV